MKQRIVFVNLHADWMLVKTASVIVYKFSPAIKHGYLLRYLLNHTDQYEICSCLNDRAFSLFGKGPDWLQKILNLFAPLEHRWIMGKNGIDRKIIKVIRPGEIKEDDIVLLYNIMGDGNLRMLQGVKAFKAVSFLHFHGRTGEDKAISAVNPAALFNEVDLSASSEIYRRFYPALEGMKWITHPFVFQERFKNKKTFAERQNKAFSVGTITYKTHPEFIEVYTDPCDQPVRKFVKDNPEYFADTIDCYSEDYLEGNEGKKVKDNDNALVKIYKKIYNRFATGQQKKYFSFDMVEKFNDYKMHIVGEEILGVPGIGYVEGMACGSAYIGLDSPMYRDLGFIPGEHYIAYDGTKEGLRKTIEHYQRPENQAELERIAATGCEYVRKHFNGDTVAETLLADLQRLKKESI